MAGAPMIRHDHAELGDVRLRSATAGQGPAVVLLHGWLQAWHMWRGIIAGLAVHRRVSAPDLRGLGNGSRPDGCDKMTLAQDVWRLAHGGLRTHLRRRRAAPEVRAWHRP